jgi:hypothetical protein
MIELVETRGELRGGLHLVGEQALNAHRHVIDASRRIEPWCDAEGEVGGYETLHRPPCDLEQRADTGSAAAGADAPQSLGHEHPVVGIERYEVGDRPQGNEVEELGGAGGSRRRQPLLVEPPLQCRYHVEGHPHSRERAALEETTGQVGIDDDVGRGKVGARQMMIRDQDVDAARASLRHPGRARNAIVHGDDQRGSASRRQPHDLRCEAVPELEPVGHEKVDRGEAPRGQGPDDERGTGGAVGIEVADHEYPTLGAMLEQQIHRGGDALQRADGQ